MSERKPCVRCGRSIDAVARICPFCNWMQDEAVPPAPPRAAEAAPTYVPPADLEWRKPVFGAIGAVLLLILSFVIGVNAHGRNPSPPAKDAAAAAAAPAPSKAASRQSTNLTLVPDNEPMPAVGMPITSAPAETPQQGIASEYNRTDATAASSSEYAQMAVRAAAENAAKKKTPTIVDPRMISGSAYGDEPPVRHTAVLRQRMSGEPGATQVVRTPPFPEYQPMPDIRLSRSATARIEVTVGADGRVHEVNVLEPLPGQTARLIAAVQMWRFRPATENGVPVPSSFSTAISFHANE